MSDYKKFALDLAEKAGEVIKEKFTLGIKKEWKSDDTPVTEADLFINKMVINAVGKEFPDHGVIAEEESNLKESEYLWVCDPLDGTIPFSHGIPICTFSLALVKNGQSILGVVSDPFMKRMFFAEKGKGAFLNDKQIFTPQSKDLKKGIIAVDMYRLGKFSLLDIQKSIYEDGGKVVNFCSVVYEGMLVALGGLIGTIFPGSNPHDCAATKIIVEEAGGKVTDLFGEESDYSRKIKGAIISNGEIHNYLLEKVKANLKFQ